MDQSGREGACRAEVTGLHVLHYGIKQVLATSLAGWGLLDLQKGWLLVTNSKIISCALNDKPTAPCCDMCLG